jgi:Flp pilus assembly protein TadG
MRFLKSESGTSMIEFAIIAPVLIFMMIGVMDVGRYAYDAILAANAARAGAQYASQDLSTAMDSTGIKNAIVADGQNLSNWNSGITAQYYCSSNGGTTLGSCSSGEPSASNIYYVKVVVTGSFTPLVNYPGIHSPLPVSGSAIMRVAAQ